MPTTTTPTRTGTTPKLWSINCAPECGFMVRDHNETEIVQLGVTHMKMTHGKTMTTADIKPMVKPA